MKIILFLFAIVDVIALALIYILAVTKEVCGNPLSKIKKVGFSFLSIGLLYSCFRDIFLIAEYSITEIDRLLVFGQIKDLGVMLILLGILINLRYWECYKNGG